MAKRQENKNIKILSRTVLATASFLLLFLFTQGSVQSYDCDLSADKDKCEAYEKKAKAYQDIIDIKAKAQATLQSQLAVIDAQQVKTENDRSRPRPRPSN